MPYKQVLVVRADLKLPKGKLASQVAHAAVEAVLRSDDDAVKHWHVEGQKKVVVKVKDEKELLGVLQKAKQAKLTVVLICDGGHTVVEPGTKTAVGIGPDKEEKIDKITGKLKLV